MIALGVVAVVLLAGVVALLPMGLRAGDRTDDAELTGIEPLADARGVKVTLSNPSQLPVLVGIKLRRCGIRLRVEGQSYVRVRTSRTSSDLLPRHMDVVGVVAAGETAAFAAPADPGLSGRAELITIVGQDRRLREIHRLITLPLPQVDAPAAHEAPLSATSPLVARRRLPRVADSRPLR
jgi:hypothetical protein